jgi:opacity protein-like surface antigen
MKNVKLSLFAMVALGSMLNAGGDISVVTPYEVEDEILAQEAYVEPVQEYVAPVQEEYVEPVQEAYVAPEPAPAPAPVVEPEPAPAPTPAPVVVTPAPVVVAPTPVKHINPSGFYAGLGIAAAQYTPNCSCPGKNGKDKTAGVMARVGYDFNQYIGIEARGIRTNWKSNGGKIKHGGIFVKPMLPVTDQTNIYGLAGFAKTKTQGSLQKTNASGLALGVGVEVDLSKDTPKEGRYGRTFDGKGNQEKGLGVFADYERLLIKSGAPKLDAVSAGLTYDF